MAISVIQSASTLSPAYNPMVFVVDSTNKNNLSFRYIFDIYNDTTSVKIASVKVAPEPLSGYGYTDISRIINTNLTYDINPTLTAATSASSSIIKYRVELSEEFLYAWPFNDTTFVSGGITSVDGSTAHLFQVGDQVKIIADNLTLHPNANGLHTVISIGATSFVTDVPFVSSIANPGDVYFANNQKTTNTGATLSNLYAFNGALSSQDFRTYNQANYTIPQSPSGTTREMLTDMPSIFNMTPDQDLFLNFFKDTGDIVSVNAKFANSNGDAFQMGSVWTSSFSSRIGQFAAGPNNANPLTVTTGTLPLVKSDTEWYDVWLSTAASTQLTQKYRINIDRRCKIEDYEILFLDRMGSFVSYAFQLRAKETGSIERKNYNQFLGTIDNTGWSYETTDGGQTNYSINVNKDLELNTNWMTDEMSVYFEQLLTSPVTFIKDTDGLYYPVIIQDGGFEVTRQKNKNLIKKTIKVRYSNQNKINI